jgi:hypothetical protein
MKKIEETLFQIKDDMHIQKKWSTDSIQSESKNLYFCCVYVEFYIFWERNTKYYQSALQNKWLSFLYL